MLYDAFVSAYWFQAVSLFLLSVTNTDQSLGTLASFFFLAFYVCKSGKGLLCCMMMHLSRLIGFKLFHFVWPRLFAQTRVLVSLREVFLGLFIFSKVGKNFCIRCVTSD